MHPLGCGALFFMRPGLPVEEQALLKMTDTAGRIGRGLQKLGEQVALRLAPAGSEVHVRGASCRPAFDRQQQVS